MKIIVPMAGRGTRLRPHTLTTPKPLLKVVGKPIVQRLVEDLAAMFDEPIEEIAYIIGDFGEQVEKDLVAIAEKLGAKGSIYHQDKPLGTAHAILCAAPSLSGNLIIAFADTLFQADFKINKEQDGIIWVQKVEDPRRFGVVKFDADGYISDFVEKPETFVSDLAIIGIYYMKDGENLRAELQYLLDNNITDKGEYQLTNALENMKSKGLKFSAGTVNEWLDCGNKPITVETNQRYMELIKHREKLVADDVKLVNSVVVAPCFIASGVEIHNSVVGPHVSLGTKTKISGSIIKNSIIQDQTTIQNANLEGSMVGSNVKYIGKSSDLSLGDFNEVIL